MVNQEDAAQKISDVGNALQYTGSAGTIVAGLALSEIGVLVGIFVAIFGFFMNWYYKHKHYKLQQQRFAIEVEAIKNGKISTLEETNE